jgi:hypothetical protein
MILDPHDAVKRMPEYSKDQELERYIDQLNLYLQNFELEEVPRNGESAIVYIVGLPRSGTTLLSQLVSRYLPVGYVNNLIARFWSNPVVGIHLSRAVLGSFAREKIALSSVHGVTADPWGPHEFGYFWRHWLRLDESRTHRLDKELLSKVDRNGLRRVLDRMSAAHGSPMVFKNIICGLQASLLSEVRPASLFVYIERDPDEVAASLLRSRKERYGDPSVWWSLKPSTYDEIRAINPPEEQVRRQVMDGTRDFRQELGRVGVQSLSITYEQLCADPNHCLHLIADAMGEIGSPVSLLGTPLPLTASRRK